MTKTRQWSVFTAVAVVVVLLAGWILLVKPQSTKASNLRSQATTQQANNAVLQSQIAALQGEQKNLPQQQAALTKFATQVPGDPSEPTLIRQLQAAAAGAGVDLVSITPGVATPVAAAASSTSLTPAAPTTTTNQLLELPLALGITGTYPNVESFFQQLETLQRALLVGGWSLCPDGGPAAAGGSGLSCTLPATPSNKTLAPNSVGGTLSAYVFYAPPTGTAVTPSTGLATPNPVTTTPTTAPSTATSTAATTPPTAASSAPAN